MYIGYILSTRLVKGIGHFFHAYSVLLDQVLYFHCWSKVDLISVWKKVHAMKWLFIYRRDLVACYVVAFFLGGGVHFFISFKYDFSR